MVGGVTGTAEAKKPLAEAETDGGVALRLRVKGTCLDGRFWGDWPPAQAGTDETLPRPHSISFVNWSRDLRFLALPPFQDQVF